MTTCILKTEAEIDLINFLQSECPIGNATGPQETITHKDAFESLKDYIKEIYNE